MLAEIVTIVGVDSESEIEEGVAGGKLCEVFRADVEELFPLAESAGFSERAAINGFQIVGHSMIPEPSLGVMAMEGGLILGRRRKRTVDSQ